MHSHVGQENTECIFGVNFGHNHKSFVCGVTGMKVMFLPSVFFTYLLLSLFSDQRRIKEVRLYLTKLRLNPERVERPKKEVQDQHHNNAVSGVQGCCTGQSMWDF